MPVYKLHVKIKKESELTIINDDDFLESKKNMRNFHVS